jgi:hypothetical protein
MFRFFRGLKLYFTDRPYYKQWKPYMKRQKAVRKELKKQAKEFCPWSGYYMHKMIVTMLEFYYKTYEAKDCCWSESAWNGKVAESLKRALDAADGGFDGRFEASACFKRFRSVEDGKALVKRVRGGVDDRDLLIRVFHAQIARSIAARIVGAGHL